MIRFLLGVLLCTAVQSSVHSAQVGYDTLISHKGESLDAPENTLPAYKTAVERGFGFECDVYLSKDGRVFTFHDKDFSRMTNDIRLAYDGDEAGRLAIERSSKLLLQGGMNVSVVILEDENDPDSYIKEKGQEEFLSYLTQNTQDAISYQIENMLHPEEPPIIYSQKLSAILEEISFVQNPVQQVVYLHRCAEKTGIHQTILYKLLENFK